MTVEYLITSFLIFVRITALVGTAPFFGNQLVPVRIKAFFALALTIIMAPVMYAASPVVAASASNLQVVVLILKEILVGAAMGLTGQIIFAGIRMGGELMSVNIGLSFASVVDPVNQAQGSIVSQLFGLLAILVFLSIGGDTYYIQALARSFEIVPVGEASMALAAPVFIKMAMYLFVVGVQMAAPFIVVLFLLDLSFAIFARIMPQANIFFIALPLKLGIGIILMLLILPYTPMAFDHFFQKMWDFLWSVLQAIG